MTYHHPSIDQTDASGDLRLGDQGSEDQRFMALALALGRRGLGNAWPNPAVGAVLVREEPGGPVVVGRGWTQPGGRPHAEAEAIARAGAAAKGATLYVTLEPCSHHGKTPPCADAIIAAGITRVVSALEDPNPDVAGKGHARLRAHGIKVDIGVGAAEAARAHAGHISRIRLGRPHITLKLAISADAKVALAGRRPIAITGARARDFVHRMRAQNDAILVGIGTVLSDDPQLTCRLPGMERLSPVRVVLDTRLRLPPGSALVRTAQTVPTWVVVGPGADRVTEKAAQAHGVKVFRVAAHAGRLDLAAAMHLLADQGITRLMVEGGPTIATALIAEDLVDTAVLLRSRHMIGADGIAALDGLPLTALTQSPHLTTHAIETVGDDVVETFERA
jgi:diaminohydroxyphosphoribosylaminopyrimidine deaminase / 5-amino-6-(5-phosphoribosylamino)uracil reductase